MNRNVEIKARLHDPAGVEVRAAAAVDGPVQVLLQEDTFFRTSTGRLKLRVFDTGLGDLISYERPDAPGPNLSRYAIFRTPDPEALKQALSPVLGVLGVVRKVRRLCLVGQTRVHLDTVEGLGAFIELEVVLAPEQTETEGEEIARGLMQELGIAAEDLVSGAYLDLLLREGADARR